MDDLKCEISAFRFHLEQSVNGVRIKTYKWKTYLTRKCIKGRWCTLSFRTCKNKTKNKQNYTSSGNKKIKYSNVEKSHKSACVCPML